MQQRRLRLGDILDDYCPRERRITNHAVVAMIDDQVKQTRCTTCDADHEYKQARVPVRRKKEAGALLGDAAVGTPRPRPTVIAPAPIDQVEPEIVPPGEFADTALPSTTSAPDAAVLAASDNHAEPAPAEEPPLASPREGGDEDGPVHRRLIRATLPRPEGQAPEWKNPDFTIRQPGGGRGGHDANRNGHRASRGGRRTARAQSNTPGQSTRFGGQRQGNARPGSGQPHGHGGNRGGGRSGQGHGHGQGQHRGQRQGGHGRKRGR
jgi:hypothetical protein